MWTKDGVPSPSYALDIAEFRNWGKRATKWLIGWCKLPICADQPLPCPSGCSKHKIVRINVACHLSEDCPDELVPCTYAIAGCQHIVKRKDLDNHLQDKQQHLDVVLSSYVSLTILVPDLLYGSTPNIPLPLRRWLQNTPTCYPRPSWVFKMEGFQEKKEKSEEWYSDPVYSHFGGYKGYQWMALLISTKLYQQDFQWERLIDSWANMQQDSNWHVRCFAQRSYMSITAVFGQESTCHPLSAP